MAGERTLPGLGLTGFWDLGSAYKTGMDTNLLLLSALVQPRVLSVLAAAPGTPADGDMHIASAAWGGGAANDLMVRDAGAWVALTPGEGWLVYDLSADGFKVFDGAAWVVLVTGGGGGSSWYDLRLGFKTTPSASEVIDTIPVIRDLTLPANLAGAVGVIGTNPTASMVLSVKDDGVEVATITISTTGSFTFATTGGVDKVVAAGSILTIVGPASADATAANASITIPGVGSTPRPKKRYWRIFVTDTNYSGGSAGDAVAIAEVTWTDFFGASVPKPGTVTVTADSQFSGSDSADKAYDNNTASYWSGYGPAIPGWIAFDFGAGAVFDFRQVTIRARNDSYYTQAPRDFQIQYSDDGATWTTYWSKAGITWSAGLAQTFYM